MVIMPPDVESTKPALCKLLAWLKPSLSILLMMAETSAHVTHGIAQF